MLNESSFAPLQRTLRTVVQRPVVTWPYISHFRSFQRRNTYIKKALNLSDVGVEEVS